MKGARPDWAGRTVVCIASGPSLTADDCELVRAAAVPTVVTNTTFRMCPWADVLFGMDLKWWLEYHEEAKKTFTGRLLAGSGIVSRLGIESVYGCPWFTSFGNSGASAISLAVAAGATKVVLVGFDAQRTGGQTHWHGDHPSSLSNAASLKNWPRKFDQVAAYAKGKGCKVVNASRATALTCFDRSDLRAELAQC
jgi:hypothetical protein